MKIILVYITNPNKKTALKVSKYLIEKRLAACVNIFKTQSLYWSKGKIESSGEYVIIAKTLSNYYAEIEKEVRKIHPYEIPCILSFKVDKINNDYLNWLLNNIK